MRIARRPFGMAHCCLLTVQLRPCGRAACLSPPLQTKEQHGKACKICERPFTIYRWKPGPKARYKKTELCHTCAKIKNACQTCILDLQFGLPLQVRDQALAEHMRVSVPKSDVGRGYMIEQAERAMEAAGPVAASNVVDISTLQKGRSVKRTDRHRRQKEGRSLRLLRVIVL